MIAGGGCHCGVVRWKAEIEPPVVLLNCNCSVCSKTGYLHMIVAHDRFALLSGADSLTSYRFGSGAAEHLFCRTCGIKSFYRPRSHPDCWSVNFRCLDPGSNIDHTIASFDGRAWEAARAELGS